MARTGLLLPVILVTLLPSQIYILLRLHNHCSPQDHYTPEVGFLEMPGQPRLAMMKNVTLNVTKSTQVEEEPWKAQMPWIRMRDSNEEESAEEGLAEEEPPPPRLDIRVAVATVPREDDPKYLLETLQSLANQGFPQDHIHVYFHAPPDKSQHHKRWNQGAHMFPDISFYRNEAPSPAAHPAIFEKDGLQTWFGHIGNNRLMEAHRDPLSRKEWRRKECWDFVRMMQHQLYSVVPNMVQSDWNQWWERKDQDWKSIDYWESKLSSELRTKLQSTIVIFNEDDVKWRVPYWKVQEILDQRPLQEYYDFYGAGTLAWGFRGDALFLLIQTYAPQWCDFKPIDWVLQDYFYDQSPGAKAKAVVKSHRFVEHIGKISTLVGRVEGVTRDRLKQTNSQG